MFRRSSDVVGSPSVRWPARANPMTDSSFTGAGGFRRLVVDDPPQDRQNLRHPPTAVRLYCGKLVLTLQIAYALVWARAATASQSTGIHRRLSWRRHGPWAAILHETRRTVG
jgi:hypothetical protein